MLFDRDKVRLQIDVDGRTTFQPGQAVTGRLTVEVLKDVQVTAIRLLARGKETTSFSVKKGGGRGNQKCEESYIHYQHLITFFGFSMESGRTGGASLQEGTYEYPFQFVIPPSAPPSYHCRMAAGTAELEYILRATVDIPRGFDGKKEVRLVVLPTIARQQYDQLRDMRKVVSNKNVALAIDPGCCGMHKDPGAAVEVAVDLPMISLLPPDPYTKQSGSPAPNEEGEQVVRIRLTLRNMCRKAHIRTVRITLQQHQRLLAQDSVADGTQTVASAEVAPPSGELIPRSASTFEVALRMADAMRHSSKMSQSDPLPTMATPCMQVSNFLTVSFPGLGAEAVIPISDVLPIVAAVDPTNTVPVIPCTYSENTIYPEEKLGAE